MEGKAFGRPLVPGRLGTVIGFVISALLIGCGFVLSNLQVHSLHSTRQLLLWLAYGSGIAIAYLSGLFVLLLILARLVRWARTRKTRGG